jgi:hypothetical protein
MVNKRLFKKLNVAIVGWKIFGVEAKTVARNANPIED